MTSCPYVTTLNPPPVVGPDNPPCNSCQELVDGTFNNASNNIMGGQDPNDWISPLQMGRRRRVMHLSPIRKFAKDVNSDAINTWNITLSEMWDFDIQMYQDIIVKAGNTLTVKCKIAMAKGGKIIVEKGAKLVVDGGEITTWSKSDLWKGIEVEGTYGQPQLIFNPTGYAADFGIVNIINNALITNAHNGVTNARSDANGNIIWGNQGGIIIAENANFVNNLRDVQFLSYQNPMGNDRSYFHKCNFKTTSALINNWFPIVRVSMWDTRGISFLGCNFEYAAGNAYQLSNKGEGIYSIDATYNIDQYCANNNNNPCNTPIKTQFKGFDNGLVVDNSNPLRVVRVMNTNFYDNHFSSTFYNNVTTPIFENNYVRTSSIGGAGTGLYLNNCKNYNVRNNTFLQNTALVDGGDVGIYANNSQAGAHSIYRNSFANFAVGIGAIDNNSGVANSTDGLKMNCNDFTPIANAYDVALMGTTPTVMKTQGQTNLFLTNATNLVRNRYAAPTACSNCETQWYIQDASAKLYDHGANSNANTRPVPQPELSDVAVNVVNSGKSLLPAHCPPSNTPPNPPCPCSLCCRLADINSAFGAAKAQVNNGLTDYNTKLDNGNTQTLLTAIYSTINPVNLKNMLAAAPFLSDTVLKAYFSKTGVPPGHVKDVHWLNAPVTGAVWEKLSALNLPIIIKNQITTRQNAVKGSNRDGALAQINLAKFNLQDVASQKLNYFLTDDLPASKDSVVKELQTNPGGLPDAEMLLVFAHLNKGDITEATKANLDLKSVRPQLADYMEKLISLQTVPEKAFSLNNKPGDLQFLTAYAANTQNTGYSGAQAILKFVKGINYQVPRLYPVQQSNSARSLNDQINDISHNEAEISDFKVYPNPANQIVSFMHNKNAECTHITLTSALGTVVYTADVKANNPTEINLSNFNAGMYLLTAYNGKLKVYQTKVIYIK